MQDFFSSKQNRLWVILSGFFVTNAIVAEFIGVKLFSLEKVLGIPEVNWTIFGQPNLSFTLTVGVILWPIVFVMTDIINEYYGPRGVRTLSYLTAGLIAYGFIMLLFAIQLQPADFWRTAHIQPDWSEDQKAAMLAKVSDYNTAFAIVFGQSQWIIVGSLMAFLVSQIVDVTVFHRIKSATGESKLWMRSTGSTLVSQFIDSFVVIFIALYLGLKLTFVHAMALCVMSYMYKATVAMLMTPLVYLVHELIDRYLGPELAKKMKDHAQGPP
jgi:uncharacterized PurR-regulated membrane protein YhhQ (DUF165 family)